MPPIARKGTTVKMAVKGKKPKAAADIMRHEPIHKDNPTVDIGTAVFVLPQ
jgi:hypothetical protein